MGEALRKRATEIRDETTEGANTAERVGGVMVDTIVELDEVRTKLDEFMGFTYVECITIPADGGGVVLGVKTTCKEWEVR